MTRPTRIDDVLLRAESDTRRAAQQAMGPWIASLAAWDWYVTLTYDPKRSPSLDKPPTDPTCTRQAAKWLTDIHDRASTFLVAVMALEHHQSGWPHWHGLVKTGHIPHAGAKALYKEWYSLHGYARIEPVGRPDVIPIADYVAKYLCKEGAETIIDWRPRALSFGAIQSLASRPSLRQMRLEEGTMSRHNLTT